MNFRNLIDENLIILDSECKTKVEAIEKLVDLLNASGVLENRDEFLKVVMERETKSPTGLEDGLAIPHGKSTTVKSAKISAMRLKNKITDWESVDEDNEVDQNDQPVDNQSDTPFPSSPSSSFVPGSLFVITASCWPYGFSSGTSWGHASATTNKHKVITIAA